MIKSDTVVRRKIFSSMVLVGVIPVVTVAIISGYLIGHRIRAEQLRRDHALTRQIGRQINQVIASTVEDLEILATNTKLTSSAIDAAARKQELVRITRPGLPDISLLDRSGFIVETTGDVSEVQDYSPWFTSALSKQQTIVSSPYRQQAEEQLLISFYIPVAPSAASATAIIKATLSFNRIAEILRSVEPAQSDFLALVDGRGNLLVSTSDDLPLAKLKEIGLQNRQAANAHGICQLDNGRSLVYSAHEVIPPNQLEFTRSWILTYFRDPAGIMAIVYQTHRFEAIVTTIGVLFAALFSWLLSKRLTRSIQAKQKSTPGKGDIRLKVYMPDRRKNEA